MEWEDALFTEGPAGVDMNEKEVISNRAHKTDEEIRALSTDDALTEVERATYILKNGNASQKQAVISCCCTQIFKDYISDAKIIILPLLFDLAIPSTESTVLAAMANLFMQLLESNLLTPKTINQLVIICKKLCLSSNEIGDWDSLFVELIKYIALDTIEQEVITETSLERGLKLPSNHRCFVARILGALSARLGSKRLTLSFNGQGRS